MTLSIKLGKGYNLIFSDSLFADMLKKPTISIYDEDINTYQKIASFNSQEAFEWFCREMLEVQDADCD